MGRDVFYITTPIYYPHDVPHVGHAYDAVTADVIARHHRLRGEEVFHLTGTDEHGLKLQRAAEAAGMEPSGGSTRWSRGGGGVGPAGHRLRRLHPHDEPRHAAVVVKVLDQVRGNGRDDIYLDTCERLYCVSCELYYVEGDLLDGQLSDPRAPGRAGEGAELLLPALGLRGPPAGALRADALRRGARHPAERGPLADPGGLRDFSISRTNFDWGIPLPWDSNHVTYVWFDALTDYLTGAGFGSDDAAFARRWPANIHMIGKDILRQHAIYWPAMLMAAGIDHPPRSGPTGS